MGSSQTTVPCDSNARGKPACPWMDPLAGLQSKSSLPCKLQSLYKHLRSQVRGIDRISVAVYDPGSDLLAPYCQCGHGRLPTEYRARLDNLPSLKEILVAGEPRVVNDLAVFSNSPKLHTQIIARLGYASSFTMPVCGDDECLGFVFFNSYQKDMFRPRTLDALSIYGHLLSVTIIHELSQLSTLRHLIKAARDLTSVRDIETGAHLMRMSHYARLIARKVVAHHGLDEAYVQKIFLYASVHDVGKLGLPDCVLYKAGKLTPAEYELVKTHTTQGRRILDTLLDDFGLGNVEGVEILRNITQYHHEALNGTGYPLGLSREAIPLEARIVAVADVFDALTSRRPYKDAWSNAEAFAMLSQMAGSKLDPECVAALSSQLEEVEHIQRRFGDDGSDNRDRATMVSEAR